jgi:uncharacterized protein
MRLQRFSIFLAQMVTLLLVLSASSWAQSSAPAEFQALRSKAQAGDAAAQFELAEAFDFARGVPQDQNEALRWYKAAATQGLAAAQNSTGSILLAQKNYAEAVGWFERASAQSNVQSINSLAYLYDTGQGVKQDRSKSLVLYTQAANMGWAESMWNLANMYGVGIEGSKPDYMTSCTWTIRAAKHLLDPGSQVLVNIQKALPIFEKLLTPAQQETCRKQGEGWQPPQAGEPKKGN